MSKLSPEMKAKRETIEVIGARVHNLQNVHVEIPRDKLTVITGLSGSGKSSLAFDTIYAEGQRRYMESLSSYAKRFIAQITKPDVDFVFGLSPVISIEQKTVGRNPRSTVGTLTEISNYLNLLFATIAKAHCPHCQQDIPIRSHAQILDLLLSLPKGTLVEIRAPIFPIYGEDLEVLFTEVRKKGYRHLVIDGKPFDLSEHFDLDESQQYQMEVVIDRLSLRPGIDKSLLTALQNAMNVGDPFISIAVEGKTSKKTQKLLKSFGCPKHQLAASRVTPDFFAFNTPNSACRTCLGLGTYMHVHQDLLVPAPERSIREGCFVQAAFEYNPDNWTGRQIYSLAQHYGFDLDTPFQDLKAEHVEVLLYGTKGEKFILQLPPEAKAAKDPKHRGTWFRYIGQPMGFHGIASQIERSYKHYRQKQIADSYMEAWLEKVMVEKQCPDCKSTRLKHSRSLFTINDADIFTFGEINFAELENFLKKIKPPGGKQGAGHQILKEIQGRLQLLLGIGLDYLNFNRRSATLSGGESQRIRLSTQIGSGLMGMLYVLDEPSIGLHPKDNVKMLSTLRSLRDLGNTVIVVEHDEETIRAADHIIEMGPGPGIHGGQVVAQGPLARVLSCEQSPTGQYLSGEKHISLPEKRRKANGKRLTVHGARENNLKNIRVEFPLGTLTCITGASGSGKSTLLHEVLYKGIYKKLYDNRTLPGKHDSISGIEHVDKLTLIDQAPIGRSSRSNPATYLGFFDNIRKLFAEQPLSKERGYKPGRFSFNVKTGRCPECSGEGTITTKLYFMPDVEVRCETCKGARFNPQTLEIRFQDRNIADILEMSIEEGVSFFQGHTSIQKKLRVLDELGLGYLTLGQSSTTLSGGEAQRIKLANELSKLRKGKHTLYILDEPTTGLHIADIARLLECLQRLVQTGHTVVIIEHHLDVIKTADWVIDLGPEGGHGGGEVLVSGSPEKIARCSRSHTGTFLKDYL